jgi:hypothetical protein
MKRFPSRSGLKVSQRVLRLRTTRGLLGTGSARRGGDSSAKGISIYRTAWWKSFPLIALLTIQPLVAQNHARVSSGRCSPAQNEKNGHFTRRAGPR